MRSNKTLIVFDANKLRSTIYGGPSYGSFEFSVEFQEIKTFIINNKLSDVIHVAIPRIVLDELLIQKLEQYQNDVKDLPIIQRRLKELFKLRFQNLKIPPDFNCKNKLNRMLEKTISDEYITIIDLPEDKMKEIFRNIIYRVVERRPPFKGGRNSSDIGFKDVLLWESLINYEKINDYHKVILFSSDSVFNEKCKEEFESKIKKYISIIPSTQLVITEMNGDYEFLIRNKEFLDFANSSYFKDYLSDMLSKMDHIEIDEERYKLKNVEIVKYFVELKEEIVQEEENDETIYTVISLLKGEINIGGVDKAIRLKAWTFLDEKKGIISTELRFIKYE